MESGQQPAVNAPGRPDYRLAASVQLPSVFLNHVVENFKVSLFGVVGGGLGGYPFLSKVRNDLAVLVHPAYCDVLYPERGCGPDDSLEHGEVGVSGAVWHTQVNDGVKPQANTLRPADKTDEVRKESSNLVRRRDVPLEDGAAHAGDGQVEKEALVA